MRPLELLLALLLLLLRPLQQLLVKLGPQQLLLLLAPQVQPPLRMLRSMWCAMEEMEDCRAPHVCPRCRSLVECRLQAPAVVTAALTWRGRVLQRLLQAVRAALPKEEVYSARRGRFLPRSVTLPAGGSQVGRGSRLIAWSRLMRQTRAWPSSRIPGHWLARQLSGQPAAFGQAGIFGRFKLDCAQTGHMLALSTSIGLGFRALWAVHSILGVSPPTGWSTQSVRKSAAYGASSWAAAFAL